MEHLWVGTFETKRDLAFGGTETICQQWLYKKVKQGGPQKRGTQNLCGTYTGTNLPPTKAL